MTDSNPTTWQRIIELSKNLNSDGTGTVDDGTRELDEMVIAYFRERLTQANGQVTSAILREADQLYDVRGMSTVLADALGLQVYDLQKALGQTQQRACENCGNLFQVHALRRKGGYWVMDSSAICPKCRRDESAERRDDERSQRELYREAYLSRRAVDIELAQAKDPLKIKAFCDHLTVLRQVWERGRVSQEDSLQQRHVVRGCMICGQDTTLIVFLTRETMPQDDHFFADETWAEDRFFGFEFTESGSYYLEGLPPLAAPATTAQVIWRYAPEHYFDTLRLPVFAMPLVLVCEHCAIVVPPTYVRTKI